MWELAVGSCRRQEQGQVVFSLWPLRPRTFFPPCSPTQLFLRALFLSDFWLDLGRGVESCVILPQTRRINMSFGAGRVPLLKRRVLLLD